MSGQRVYTKKQITHERIYNKLKIHWPNLVIQHRDELTVYKTIEKFLEEKPPEFFVYKNNHWFKEWDKHGAIEENDNTMIHFILECTDIEDKVLVVDDIENIKNIIIDIAGEKFEQCP